MPRKNRSQISSPVTSFTYTDTRVNILTERLRAFAADRERKDKAAKVATARNLRIPAVNNHGGFDLWAFLEISDPWDAQNTIRSFINRTLVDGILSVLQSGE